jgi:hypothetical protein
LNSEDEDAGKVRALHAQTAEVTERCETREAGGIDNAALDRPSMSSSFVGVVETSTRPTSNILLPRAVGGLLRTSTRPTLNILLLLLLRLLCPIHRASI